MSRRAPIRLPPSHIDLAIARFCARQAFPGEERTLRALTVLADEKTVVAGALLYWAYSRLDAVAPAGKREADRMACAVLVASALPHVLKHLFDRQRPDRSVMRGRRRRGIPRSGEPYDSFPSGHAINIGAIAGPLARLVPPHLRPAVWPVLTLLAASRVLLLAHYPSDVAAGLVLGTFIERVTDQLASGRFAKLSNCCCRLSAHSAARGIALRIRASDLRRRSSSDDGSATGQTPFLRRNLPRARRGRVSFQPQ